VTGTDLRAARSSGSRTGNGGAGFTVIELLVVVSIIVILAGMAMAQYRSSVTRAQEAVLMKDLFTMRDALDQYYADKQRYAPTLDALVTEGYLRQIPKDPFTGSAETWQTIQAEPDPSNRTAELGIINVKSGSERSGTDGTPYADK
jgi:general secretion pathway protein G